MYGLHFYVLFDLGKVGRVVKPKRIAQTIYDARCKSQTKKKKNKLMFTLTFYINYIYMAACFRPRILNGPFRIFLFKYVRNKNSIIFTNNIQ